MQNTAVRTWLHCSVTNRARSRMPPRSLCVWPRGLPGWVMCLPLTLQNQTPNVKTVGCYSITTRTLLVRWSTWGTSLYSVGCLKLDQVGRSPEMLRTSGASLPDRTKPETLWVRVPLLWISHGWNTWPWNVPSSHTPHIIWTLLPFWMNLSFPLFLKDIVQISPKWNWPQIKTIFPWSF